MLNKEVEFASVPISLSQTYGNMTAYIVEFIKKHFDSDYFTNVTVASKIAYRYFDIFNNTNKEFLRRSKPYLIVRPRLELDGSDKFLDGTYLTQRMFNGYDGDDYGNLVDFYRDDNIKLECRYLLNRYRMVFDVTMMVETMNEQMNLATYLKNTIVTDRPIILNCSLESLIPSSIINVISQLSGIKVEDTADFLEYMNGKSVNPITFKRRNSTGNDEFFRYYPANVDCTIGNLTIDDGNRKGMTDDTYTVGFTVSAEFYGAGLYQIFSQNKDSGKSLKLLSTTIHDSGNGSVVDMMFTLHNIGDKLGEGWQTYAAPTFKVEQTAKPDKIYYGDLINTSISQSIDYHMEKKLPFDNLINFEVYQDSELLTEGVDYTMNYGKKSLTLFKLNRLSTYRLVININIIYINQLVIELLDREEK